MVNGKLMRKSFLSELFSAVFLGSIPALLLLYQSGLQGFEQFVLGLKPALALIWYAITMMFVFFALCLFYRPQQKIGPKIKFLIQTSEAVGFGLQGAVRSMSGASFVAIPAWYMTNNAWIASTVVAIMVSFFFVILLVFSAFLSLKKSEAYVLFAPYL